MVCPLFFTIDGFWPDPCIKPVSAPEVKPMPASYHVKNKMVKILIIITAKHHHVKDVVECILRFGSKMTLFVLICSFSFVTSTLLLLLLDILCEALCGFCFESIHLCAEIQMTQRRYLLLNPRQWKCRSFLWLYKHNSASWGAHCQQRIWGKRLRSKQQRGKKRQRETVKGFQNRKHLFDKVKRHQSWHKYHPLRIV